MIALKILAGWLLADFITGIVHWAQDKLMPRPTRFRILNRIRFDNELHHKQPAAMIRHTLWGNVNTSVPITIPISAVLLFSGAPDVLTLAVFFSSAANIVHRWAHMPKAMLIPPIRWIQATGLMIDSEQHMRHHANASGLIMKEDTTQIYCPMTCWLNPALDRIRFFPTLERIIGVKNGR